MSHLSPLVWPAFNVAVLLVILYRFLKKPVMTHIQSRALSLKGEMEELEMSGGSIRAQMQELDSKMSNFEAMTRQAREEALSIMRQTAAELGQKAIAEGERLKQESEISIREAGREQAQRIRRQTVEVIVSELERRLQGQGGDDLRKQFEKDFESGLTRLA